MLDPALRNSGFRLFNVRLGLATNSSSTHSIIFLPDKTGGHDDYQGEGEFGWDHFTLVSRGAKMRYLAATLYQNLLRAVSVDVAQSVVRDWVGGFRNYEFNDGELYVDHQSEITLPWDWEGKGPDKQFFEELTAFLLRDGVAVLGGNDNTEQEHPLLSSGKKAGLPLPRESNGKMLVARKDDRHGYWSLFNRHNGTKVRFSFDHLPDKPEPDKAFAPELVDIKITDYCHTPSACAPYCYQASGAKGKHADTQLVSKIAHTLSGFRVFEVAIGGGEPTMHPEFTAILQTFRQYGIVPNFTTRSLDWLKDRKKREPILKAAGALAYSVSRPEDIFELRSIQPQEDEPHYVPNVKVSVQCVMGTIDRDTFRQLLLAAAQTEIRITLLGYKTVGRGADFDPIDYSWWIDVLQGAIAECKIMEIDPPVVGIDTALASQYEKELAANGVPSWCYFTKEGKFSMYVDAVAGKIGPSSYCPEDQMVGFKDFAISTVENAFARF